MRLALTTVTLCLAIGLSFGTYLYFTYDHRVGRIVVSVMSSVNIGTLMVLVITFRQFIIGFVHGAPARAVIMTVLLIVAALIGSELTFIMRGLLPGYGYEPFAGGSLYILNILIVLVSGMPMYVSEEWKRVVDSRLLSQQYRLLQLEQQKTLFELELLRAKVNPHFLYNVHNTIAGLIKHDPTRAEALVLLLSKFLRFTLHKDSATFHTVTDELEILTTYLEMQHIRYGDRMTYTIQAGEEVRQLSIPSFILQPLVENAVKHGLEVQPGNGYIKVAVSLQHDGHLLVTVADSGPAFPDIPGTGVGLQMVLDKLRLLYSSNYTFSLHNTPEKYVRLTFPQHHKNPIGR